jgi:hypothetical protein
LPIVDRRALWAELCHKPFGGIPVISVRRKARKRYGTTFSIDEVEYISPQVQVDIECMYPAAPQGAREGRLIVVAASEREGIFAVEAKILFFDTQQSGARIDVVHDPASGAVEHQISTAAPTERRIS